MLQGETDHLITVTIKDNGEYYYGIETVCRLENGEIEQSKIECDTQSFWLVKEIIDILTAKGTKSKGLWQEIYDILE